MPEFANRISRSLGDKLGEQPSALDFISEAQHAAVRAGTASANLTSAIQNGLNAVANAGGGVLYLPWGVYPVMDLTVPGNVYLQGAGGARTILKRIGNLPAGRGVLNFAGAKSGCGELAIDGQVTTPATALYSSLSDPSSSTLVANSSIRIHPGASDITLFRCRIFHSGGYAVHIDARTANVYRIEIIEPHLHDNRSFLFGATAGSEIYGSWTGGILAQGDGLTSSYGVRGLTVRDGRFRRGTGNQVWSHLYGFGTLHTDCRIQGCTFEDIGRDGVMLGGVVGGDVAGNFFRRIGYICTDDVSAGIPRWINGQWAVGLDTAGLTRGVSYRGNSFVSCYGAAMDLDGFAEGVVSDNTVIVPAAGEPEYTEDGIASWAGNYCYGVQTSNSNNIADAAVGVRVTGNRFRNCGFGAIRMYASRRGTVSGNTIEHPVGATVAPIVLGNIGSGANQRAYANTVTDNDIHYSPATITASVQEDPNGFAFSGSDINRVYGNRLHGTNTFELRKAAGSGSRTAQEFASNKSGLATESKTTLQREDGYLRAYWTNGSLTKSALSLLDQVALSGGGSGGPLLNISLDAVGGVIATGARTSSAFDDAVLSSKIYADGFLALAATTFAAAEANLLADTVGLIRYNATTKAFEQSTSASAGARVWTSFEPSRWSVLGADIYRSSGRVTIGSSMPGSLLTLRANTDDGLTVTNNTQTGVYFVSSYGGPTVGSTSSHPLVFLTGNAARGRITDAGNWLIGANTDDASGARLQIAGFARATVGFTTPATNTDAIQATAGGVTARFLIGTRSLTLVGDTAANAGVSSLGQGRIYFDATANRFRISENGGAFQDLTGAGVGSLTGTANQVNVSAATGAVTLSLPQSIHSGASPTFAGVTAGAFSATASGSAIAFQTSNFNFQVNGNGVVSSAAGFNAGGVNVIDASQNVYASTLQTTGNVAVGSPDTSLARLFARASDVNGLRIHNSGTPSPSGGAGIQAAIEAAPSSGDRLAFYAFGIRAGGASYNGAAITAFATQAWTPGSAHGTELRFETTANGASARGVRMTIGNSGLVTIGSTLAIDQAGNLTATGVVQAGGINANAASPAYNSLQTNGGVYAMLGATVDQALYLKTFAGTPNSPGGGYGALSHRSGSTYLYWNGSAWGTVDLAASGGGVASLTGTANQVSVSAATGAVTLSLPQNIHSGASPTFSGLSLSGVLYSIGSVGINAPSPQFALDVRRTGTPGNTLILQTLFNTESSYQVNSGSGLLFQYGGGHTQAMISAHIETNNNGSNGYLSLRTTTDGGATLPERVRITAAGNVLVNATTDDGSGARLQVNGFIRPITGLATPSTNTDAIQAPSGGVTARFLIGTRSLTLTSETAANAGLSGSAQGRIYFDSGTNKFRVSENGSTYVDLLSGTGVTSLTGTANQVNVSAATGAVTLSLPQNIHTAASPTFGGLSVNGALRVGSVAGLGWVDGNTTLSAGQNMVYQVATSGAALTWNANTNGGNANTVMARLQPRQDTSANYNLDVFCGSWNNNNSPGSAVATFQSTGNIGLNETNPKQRLHVFGQGLFTASPASYDPGDAAGSAVRVGYQAGSDFGYVIANNTGVSGKKLVVGGSTIEYWLSGAATHVMNASGNLLIATLVDDASGAKLQINGFARAITGFATPATATDAIQAPSGGVTARFLIGTRSLTLTSDTAANAGLSASGQGRIFYDSGTNKFRVSENGGAYVDLASGNYWRQSAWSLSNADEWPTYIFARDGSANWDEGMIKGASNRSKLGAVSAIWGPHLGTNNSFGVFSSGWDNLFEVRGGSGNVWIKGNVGMGTASVTAISSNAPKLEVVGSTRTTWGHGQNALFILPAANNGASNGDAGLYLWISEPGHTWTGAGIGRNMYNWINWPRVNSALTAQMIRFGEWADINFVSEIPGGTRYYPMRLYEDRVLVSTQTDDSSGAKLQVNGFVRAITGFATPATATDALQAPAGGVTARFLIGTRSLTLTADSAANAGLSASAQGRIYFDSGANRFRVSENGGAYVDLLGAGVSSLAGTANQVNVSASTGAVTLSLPQSIHTGASPTFAGVTAGAFSATASGASIGFQTSNFNFQVDGNGNISGSGSANLSQGFRVGGTFVIDSSRNATNLASATAAGVFQSQASGGSIAFQTTNFNFQVNGNGVVSSAGGINVSGVTCINTSRQFVGYGVDVSYFGISAGGYNVYGGYVGQTWNVSGSFTINGAFYSTLVFRGGILVSAW